jgi:NADP-dependent 3-hydroxy acid dehydrogenase YdfG
MPKSLVVITGASHGIGKALAMKFATDQYPCLLLSRHIEPFPELKDKKVLYAQVDVTDFNAIQSAIKNAEKKFGNTECLINSAGFINVGNFNEIPIEKCNYEFDVLVKGVLNGVKAVLSDMISRKSGTIINISSISDRKASEFSIAYTASKYAVRAMAECLQMAEAKNNIRVMNVAPGLIKTDIHKGMGISFEEYCQKLGNPTFIMPEELADIIYFCFQLPQRICIRDIVVMPTDCGF